MDGSEEIIFTGVRSIKFKRENKGLGSNTYIVVLEGKPGVVAQQAEATPEELSNLKSI